MALKKFMIVEGISQKQFNGVQVSSEKCAVDLGVCTIRVKSVSGTKLQCECVAEIISDKMTIKRSYVFSPSMDGPNFIKQAYLHLKTLPEFSNSEDC